MADLFQALSHPRRRNKLNETETTIESGDVESMSSVLAESPMQPSEDPDTELPSNPEMEPGEVLPGPDVDPDDPAVAPDPDNPGEAPETEPTEPMEPAPDTEPPGSGEDETSTEETNGEE